MASTEQQFLANNLTKGEISAPTVCDQLYGTANFALASDAVLWSNLTQVALFMIFGPLLACVSRFTTPRASPATRLTVARLQSVMDTIHSTGTFLSLAMIITAYVRISQGLVAGLERNVLKNFLDIANFAHNIAMMGSWIDKPQAGISYGYRRWASERVFLMTQVIGFTSAQLRNRLETLSSVPTWKSTADICHKAAAEDYPKLFLGGSSTAVSGGWSPYLVGVGLGFLIVLVFSIASYLLPKVIWSWIKAICTSRITLSILSILWFLGCTFCIGVAASNQVYLREYFKDGPEWDLSQIGVLLLWLPAGGQILLVLLTSLMPTELKPGEDVFSRFRAGFGTMFESIYRCLYGTGPSLRCDQENTEQSTTLTSEEKKLVDLIHDYARARTSDEKAPLVENSLPVDDLAKRRPSPAYQV